MTPGGTLLDSGTNLAPSGGYLAHFHLPGLLSSEKSLDCNAESGRPKWAVQALLAD